MHPLDDITKSKNEWSESLKSKTQWFFGALFLITAFCVVIWSVYRERPIKETETYELNEAEAALIRSIRKQYFKP